MTELSRQELIALGRTIVTGRLQMLGCTVKPAGGKLDVNTPSGRSLEVFVSTQRVGGYAFWVKRRLEPASTRFAAIVLLTDAEEPDVGKKSDPEYGVSLARASLPALQCYAWTDEYFR